MSTHDTEQDTRVEPGVRAGGDLRRRRRRDIVEQIVRRADWLPRDDRTILCAIYEDGRSVTEVAQLRGDDPRRLRRHVRRLVQRIMSPKYLFVAAHKGAWTPTRRRVAEACVLHGLSLRGAAERLQLTHHTVRHHYHAVNALFEAAS